MAASFPKGFLFGAGTSAYQVEGAAAEGGRAPSWWDAFAKAGGNIADGSDGDVACDHYHRFREDIGLMASLKVQAYRFSVAWPRVLPKGRGKVNSVGLDFYERLVDGLLARGIKPYATLYHWDLPLALAEKGGWQSRDTASSFAEYAEAVSRRLGDRVYSWATLNEPRCAAMVGHLEGRHAPGERDRGRALKAAHLMLLAHGMALPVLRANVGPAKVGIVLDVKPYYPADDSEATHRSARAADGVFNRWFFDAVLKGSYPEDIIEGYGALAPRVEEGDLAIISAPIDEVGLNYYTRGFVRHDASRPYPHAAEIRPERAAFTSMDWEIFPQGLYDVLTRIHRDYPGPTLYVAENGAAFDDVLIDGKVEDLGRVDYMAGHLDAAARAIADGVPLTAYLAWSLMDNFEWGRGYSKRFGLIYVDYPTQARVAKASALWYRDFIASSGTGG